MVTYELNSPLFSDYAQKWRTVWMPKGVAATYDPAKSFDFPVGTIVTKTFYYTTPADAASPQTSGTVVKMTPASYQSGVGGLDLKHVRLIETRLLVRRAEGWVAFPYVWNAEGTDATLERTGADVPLTFVDGAERTDFTYSVPNQNQCAGCHAQDFRTRKISPIGLKARHLNRTFPGEGGEINQLQRLVAMGYLKGVPAERRAAKRQLGRRQGRHRRHARAPISTSIAAIATAPPARRAPPACGSTPRPPTRACSACASRRSPPGAAPATGRSTSCRAIPKPRSSPIAWRAPIPAK